MSDYMDSVYSNLSNESREAITAGAGYNDGANNGFWRIQPRLPKRRKGAGTWMEMGAEVRAAFKKLGKLMSRPGRVVGSGGTADTVRVLHPAEPERGLPEEVVIYPNTAIELMGARLSPEYLRSIGRDPNATGTGISAMSNPANLPNYEDLQKAPATPDDNRLADQGVDSPEGQEMSQFKDSPEGQEIARLDEVSAEDVLDTPEEIGGFLDQEPMNIVESGGAYILPDGAPKADKKQAGAKLAPSNPDYVGKINGYTPGKAWINPDGSVYTEPGSSILDRTKPFDSSTVKLYKSVEDAKADSASAPKKPVTLSEATDKEKALDQQISKIADDIASLEMNASTRKDAPEALRKAVEGLDLTDIRPEYLESLKTVNESLGSLDTGVSQHTAMSRQNEAKIAEAAIARLNAPSAPAEKDYSKPTADMSEQELALGFGLVPGDRPNTWKSYDITDDPDSYGRGWDYEVYKNPKTGKYEVTRTDHSGLNDGSGQNYDSREQNWGTFDSPLEAFEEAQYHEWDDTPILEAMDAGELVPKDAAQIQADDLVERAMRGDDVNLDDLPDLPGAKKKPEDDFLDETPSDDLEGPSDEDLMDIENEGIDLGGEPEGDWQSAPIAETTSVSPGELMPGDFFKDKDGTVGRLEDSYADANGVVHMEYVTEPDGITKSAKYSGFDSVRQITFGEPTKEEVKTPEAEVTTPDVEEKAPRIAPDTAKMVYNFEAEPGDALYNTDGTEFLGNVVSIERDEKRDGFNITTEIDGVKQPPLYKRDFERPSVLVDKTGSADRAKLNEEKAKADAEEAARLEKEAADKAAAEKAAADAAAEAERLAAEEAANKKNPLHPAGVEELRKILEAHPTEFAEALKVLNNKKLSPEDKAEAIADALSMKRLPNDKASSEERVAARQAEAKAMSMLRNAGVKNAQAEEIKRKNSINQLKGFDGSAIKDPELRAEFKGMLDKLNAGDSSITKADIDNMIERLSSDLSSKGTSLDEIIPPKKEKKAPVKKNTKPLPTKKIEDPQKPFTRATDKGQEVKLASVTPEQLDKMRKRKVQAKLDENGNPEYERNDDGTLRVDKKGRPIRKEDPNHILDSLLADNPGAVVNDKGEVVLHREKYVSDSGENMQYEILVHKNTGGKIGVSVAFTNLDTGAVERLVHYDERDSYKGLLGVTNGPHKILDILSGKEDRVFGNFKTEGRKDPRDRARYWTTQKRMMTVGDTAKFFFTGRARELNMSLGADGKELLTVRKNEIPALAEAIELGDRVAIFMRMRAAAGHLPLNDESLAEVKAAARDYLRKAFPEMPYAQLRSIVDGFERSIKWDINDPNGRQRPWSTAETRQLITPGTWVEYTNNEGEISRGIVRELPPVTNHSKGGQYNDNIVVEFADGRKVSDLTSNHVEIARDQTDATPATQYKPWLTGEEMRERRRALFDDEEFMSEDEDSLGSDDGSSEGGKVDDLMAGDTLYSKSGQPLGDIVDIMPITGKNGKKGFVVTYEDENGEEVEVRIPAGEFRGPKA